MMIRARAARRRAATAVETAILLPTLVLLAVIAFDFCRVFHYYTVLTNCARDGAVYAADNLAVDSGGNVVQLPGAPSAYNVPGDLAGSVSKAAQADWPRSLDTTLPTVALATTTADGVTYAEVTVNYTFSTVVAFAPVPATVNLSRTVRVRIPQLLPTS